MRKRSLTLRSILCAMAAGLPGLIGTSGASAQEDLAARRAFSFPLTRDARDQAKVAFDHLNAARWRQAVEVLQEINIDHRGAVLPDEYRRTADLNSAHAAHPGAAQWALGRLLSLPREARDLYRDRYGRVASFAADRAIERGDRRELISVAQRWPLCDGSIRAWRVVGDIELEAGHPRAALIAWQSAQRAARIVHEKDDRIEDDASGKARRTAAIALLDADQDSSKAPKRRARTTTPYIRSPDATLARGPLPSNDADPWERVLDLEPFSRESVVARQFDFALQAELADDKVLVSSTLKLYCVDAYTGELEWAGLEHYGWSYLSDRKRKDLFQGLNRSQTLIAPAHGGRIAIAALQLPFSELPNQEYQGIEVMKSIPQRRLVAFDLETGERVWDHEPALDWNEDRRVFVPRPGGTYAQRMLIAGPPVVADSRVLVPCYVLEGRIDYHVACYDLGTGEYLWSTSVVSGQTSRNMFGRALTEFCSTPVVVVGDRVVVQTELGTIAALDLMTGRILWESLYRQIALPKTPGYQPQRRRRTWRLAPPVVTGNIIVATPSDSAEIAGLDLRDGRVLWTYDQSTLASMRTDDRRSKFNLLLGADEDTVYLSGTRVAALSKDGGLGQTGAFHLIWDYPLTNAFNSDRSPHPLLCRDAVLVPTREKRVVLDRRNGRVQHSLTSAWTAAQNGNPLVDDGLLFTLGANGLHGFFDWDLLIDRQTRRMAAAPGDTDIAIATATLYSRRANTALEDGELFAAKDYLASARRILEPMVYGTGPPRGQTLTRASDELHIVLRREARTLESRGDRVGALAALAKARPLARSRAALRDTLLQEERNLRLEGDHEKHLAILAELDANCADLAVPLDAVDGAPFPLTLAGTEVYGAPTIGFWVLMTRASALEKTGDLVAAFENWHEVIDRFAVVELSPGTRAGALARERIQAKLGIPGGRDAYGRFEARAAELYARALESQSVDELREVSRRFPHARAARDADATRLDWAYESSDAAAVASIVYGSADTGRVDIDNGALLRLARVLGRLGNDDFEHGLIESLLREDPGAISDLAEHANRPLADVLDEWTERRTTYEPLVPRFTAEVTFPPIERGSYEYVGRFLAPTEAETAPEELHVYLVRRESSRTRRADEFVNLVECFSSREPSAPTWRALLQDPVRSTIACSMSRDRVIFGGRAGVQALNVEGREVWRRKTALPVTSMRGGQGVVVCMLGLNTPESAVAFDAHTGVPLWHVELAQPGAWRAPIVGEGKVVFFSKPYSRSTTARVVDLYRGQVIADIDLGPPGLEPQVENTVWIASGKLFVPQFRSVGKGNKPNVTAYDLHAVTKLWSRELPENEDFEYIARYEDATYLITRAGSADSSGGVYVFDLEFGTIRRIVPLRAPELPIGLLRRAVTQLPTSDLFTYVESANQMVVRALHLPYQARWSCTLPAPGLATSTFMPLPAVSEDCVALAFALKSAQNGFVDEARLAFVDRNTGKRLDTRPLHEEFAKATRLELRGLSDSLFIAGRGANTRGWRFQIMENSR